MVGYRASRAHRPPMDRHRTTARALLVAAAAALSAVGAAQAGDRPPDVGGLPDDAPPIAAPATPKAPAAPVVSGSRIIFPVVGKVAYTNDFGAPRGSSRHEGIDIMAPRRAIAVAAEPGKIRLWTTSGRAGCMLYLYGRSGTTYLYIHLNNDLTSGNDNTGKCVEGVAYAKGIKNDTKVVAGQPIGFVGNSGDADGGAPHLHFELHPKAVTANPYPYLRRAYKLLLPAAPGKPFTAAVRGKVMESAEGALTLKADQVRVWPGGAKIPTDGRNVALSVPPSTVLQNPLGAFLATSRLASLARGKAAVAFTAKAKATLKTTLGLPLALSTARVVLSS
jgi:hypothetical protein